MQVFFLLVGKRPWRVGFSIASSSSSSRFCTFAASSSSSTAAETNLSPSSSPSPELPSFLHWLKHHLSIDERTLQSLALRKFCIPSLRQKIELLILHGFPPSQLPLLLLRPIFLNSSSQKLLSLLDVFHRREWPLHLATRVFYRTPGILGCTAPFLEQRLKFFEDLGASKIGLQNITTMCTPRSVLLLSLDNIQRHISLLQHVGMNTRDILRLLSVFPQFLHYNIERNLKPTIAFLDSKGVHKEVLCRVLRIHPQVLGAAPHKSLNKKVAFIQQLGLRLETEAGLKAFCCWSISSTEVLSTRFDFLKSLGLSVEEVLHMVKLQPNILHKAQATSQQKVDYLVNVLKRDVREMVKFPSYLGFSLENRIIPRFARITELKEQGLLEKEPSLATILSVSDPAFAKLIEKYRKVLLRGRG